MNRKKVLYVNCCMRENSRTEKLCQAYLEEIKKEVDFELQERKVADLDIQPLDQKALEVRDRNPDPGRYPLAYEFANADAIIIAAPYWDASFPSKLKVYIENICVNPITFAYTSDGKPVKKCRANQLVYITTAGGYIRQPSSVQLYMEELCAMFGIEDMHFYCAQGLDVFPEKVEQTLSKTLQEMLTDRGAP